MSVTAKIKQLLCPENISYSILWTIVVLIPVVQQVVNIFDGSSAEIHWEDMYLYWLNCGLLMSLFLLHNIVLLPRLLLRQKTWLYIITVVCSAVVVLIMIDTSNFAHNGDRPFREDRMHFREQEQRPDMGAYHNEMRHHIDRPHIHDKPPKPPMFLMHRMGPMIPIVLVTILMIIANIAIKLFFRNIEDKARLKELEYQSIHSELQYLKYQINPHFFMNTLNNIHALVDIDSEKAKDTIVELSKLMRYVLYETERRFISLAKEIAFLNHYIELMHIRYPEEYLEIKVDMVEDTRNIMIPPLLFISFVENAFKHGVSYRHRSSIEISIHTDETNMTFRCSNSINTQMSDQYHGIGLTNIQKRLHLLYNDRYTLSIEEKDERFVVILVLPILNS